MIQVGSVLKLFLEPLGERRPLPAGVAELVGSDLGAARGLFCYHGGRT